MWRRAHSSLWEIPPLLGFATICGLAGGLLDSVWRLTLQSVAPRGHLITLHRDFAWLDPLVCAVLFPICALVVYLPFAAWPKLASKISARVCIGLGLAPVFMQSIPGIYEEAWLVFCLGLASLVAPRIESALGTRRRRTATAAGLLVAVGCVAGVRFARDWKGRRDESARALPAASALNVLLIVLDTVRADGVSEPASPRMVTPALASLASRGVRFRNARATAPWTLASHASLLTGRLPSEVGTDWMTPLARPSPALAEELGAQGYRTAGFVANAGYCNRHTGLASGFTHYEDYPLHLGGIVRSSELVQRFLISASELSESIHDWAAAWVFDPERKSAATINAQFLGWLDRRDSSNRPFFAFLNYLDAHAPYQLPRGASPRMPILEDPTRLERLITLWPTLDRSTLDPRMISLARASYDNCIAELDHQLGRLFDALKRRGLLERTIVIVTSDHGEGFGEHGLFDHGDSLYDSEIRVPLIIVPPGGLARPIVIDEPVSLRDIPATIHELVSPGSDSRLPGRSLARFWKSDASDGGDEEPAISELASPNPTDPNCGRSPATSGPLVSLAQGRFVYIRNERTQSEQFFDVVDDPRQLSNRAADPRFQDVLSRFRAWSVVQLPRARLTRVVSAQRPPGLE